jgi:hypothetical protein
MNIREISDVFKDTANQITAIKSYNFGWASDRTRSTNTEDYQELNEFPRVFFSVPTITGSDQTRKQDTYQVTIFFDDLLGYDNNGDADLTLQIDKWAALQEYANYFVQRLNKVKQSILPNYLFIPEAPSITFDSFTGLQRMITVQLSFTLVVPTNCEPVVTKLVECIANILTSSNLTASLTNVIKLVSSLQASSSLSASALVSKLAQSNLNTESSLSANIQLAKLPSSSLNAGGTLVGDAFITRLFAASLNGNGSIFANPLITKFAASSLNANASLNASALVSKLPESSLTGAGTLAADLTVTGSATLLLDLYPNAAAAYSLRKLRTAYAGSAIRVRRSSDNTEQDIGFVNNVLDESALTTFCGVGNGFVTTWYDQSGNARNAIQATSTSQPQIVSSGTILNQNLKPCIGFTTSTILTIPSSTSMFNFLHNGTNSAIFSVVKIGNSSNPLAIHTIINTGSVDGSDRGIFIFYDDRTATSSNNKLQNSINNGGSLIVNNNKNDAITPNIQNLISILLDADNTIAAQRSIMKVNNGISIIENTLLGNPSTGNSAYNLTFGGTLYGNTARFVGNMQEIVIYPSDQTSNVNAINTNINTHYGIY